MRVIIYLVSYHESLPDQFKKTWKNLNQLFKDAEFAIVGHSEDSKEIFSLRTREWSTIGYNAAMNILVFLDIYFILELIPYHLLCKSF